MDISLQLYTVNTALESDLEGGIARLAEIGFTTVEAFDFVRRAPELKAAFDTHGVTAKTGHSFLVEEKLDLPDGVTLEIASHADTFAAAALLGMTTVIDPFVAPEHWTTREGLERTAARLNAAAVEAAKHGLSVGYHNHDHELRPRIDGRPALEVFAELLDDNVKLEVDLYWAAAAGVDPVGLLERLGDKVIAVHVKDGPIGDHIKTGVAPTDQIPAGQGDVPLAAALAAASSSVQFAVIEFDGTEGDIFDAVAASYAWLSAQPAVASATATA
jgi:sugar phosphate isomerase/epimerase